MTDRIFKDQLDLYGYNFVPNQMEIPNESQEELRMGEYTFGILGSNLYVDGKGIKGVYSVNNITPTDYGYKLTLMNARDPTVQGHLKIILTQYGHADALVFKRSTKDKEIIFFLPETPKKLRLKERDFFTDRWEMPLEDIDNLWGQTFRPFLRIHHDDNIQERLQFRDSTSISFIEKVTKIEKKQRKKKKKKKEEMKMENIELGIPDDEMEEEVVAVETSEPEPETKEEPKPKAKPKARSARKRQKFGGYQSTRTYEDTEEEEVETLVVKKPKEKIKPTPQQKEADAMEETPDSPEASNEENTEEKKYKIKREYFVQLKTRLYYDDDTSEDIVKLYPVKKIVEREDETAAWDEDKYQLEISLKKGKPIYLYLTTERTISSVEIDGKTYLMRGH
ncbi:MAG TPA: hypothetical protein ENJ45_01830 [Phaeodactylibacter sp.]|nr:hypothetical protein [Phaeodactylibacter sp.]